MNQELEEIRERHDRINGVGLIEGHGFIDGGEANDDRSALLAYIEEQEKIMEQMGLALNTSSHEDNDYNCPDDWAAGDCSACRGAIERHEALVAYRQWKEERDVS